MILFKVTYFNGEMYEDAYSSDVIFTSYINAEEYYNSINEDNQFSSATLSIYTFESDTPFVKYKLLKRKDLDFFKECCEGDCYMQSIQEEETSYAEDIEKAWEEHQSIFADNEESEGFEEYQNTLLQQDADLEALVLKAHRNALESLLEDIDSSIDELLAKEKI